MTRQDLLDAGWTEGEHLEGLLEEAFRLEQKGNKPDYIFKRLDRMHARRAPTLAMRSKGIPFSEAIEPENSLAVKNLRAVRRSMRELMASPVVEAGAIMPDACPAGRGVAAIPVGGAIAVNRGIVPAAHGADICCSLFATVFERPQGKGISDQMDALLAATRFGPGGRAPEDWVPHPVIEENVWANPFLKGLQMHARMHMADQGDGNHFAFLGELSLDTDALNRLRENGYEEWKRALRPDRCYRVLITHHGSRGLGAQVYKRGLKVAVSATRFIAKGIPDNAAWLSTESEEGVAYWDALQYLSRWTLANHQSIHQRFLDSMHARRCLCVGNEHNFVWRRGERFFHGKGATPAWTDDVGRPLLGLIPLNMACPVLLVMGGDQGKYLGFGPHGAGRNESRKALLRRYRLKDGGLDQVALERDLAQSVENLDVRWFRGRPDITECPIGYKSAASVRAQIEKFGLVNVITEIHPLGCVMAGRGMPRKEEWSPKQIRQQAHRAERRRERQRDLEDCSDE